MSENKKGNRRRERGAALITSLFISFLLLAAGGGLMLTVGSSVGTTVEPMSEMQAYYAAESGMQQVLNALRGNVAPNISYRKAITPLNSNKTADSALTYARLSNWLAYDTTYTDRVLLTPAATYSPLTGSAFNAVLSDPDNSTVVSFTTSGSFSNGTGTLSFGSGSGSNSNIGSIVFTPQTVTALNASPSAATLLGSLRVSGGPQSYTFPAGTTFNLTINQTLPWPATVVIKYTLQGSVSNLSSVLTDPLRLVSGSAKYLAEGTEYELSGLSLPLLSSATGFTNNVPVTVRAPEPRRILVEVTGFGPRASVKKMQMMVGRLVLDYAPQGTIAIRGATDQSLMNFNAGNSAAYSYSGNSPAGNSAISAFAVTNTPDYNMISGLNSSGQATGNPAVQQVPLSVLPGWLQNSDAARSLLNSLESVARNQNRLFTTANPPSTLGTSAAPQFTFVNGNVDIGSAGGAGLLVVTGTLTARGSTAFDGLILVLGDGVLLRDGGGNGNTLGAVAIARFERNVIGGPFLAPTFNSNGSGTSNVQYDPTAVQKALGLAGRSVIAVREY